MTNFKVAAQKHCDVEKNILSQCTPTLTAGVEKRFPVSR
jgi:hypothetical protein